MRSKQNLARYFCQVTPILEVELEWREEGAPTVPCKADLWKARNNQFSILGGFSCRNEHLLSPRAILSSGVVLNEL